MKMDYDRFREIAGGAEEAVEAGAGAAEEAAGVVTEEVVNDPPRMGVRMGPDGTEIDVSAPLEDMSAQEAISFAEELQSPSLAEQIREALSDPYIRAGLKEFWYGPDEKEEPEYVEMTDQQRQIESQHKSRTDPEAVSDGGKQEARPGNVYEITPEGFVAVLESQIDDLAEFKGDMTIAELGPFIEKHRSDIVAGVGELLEELSDG